MSNESLVFRWKQGDSMGKKTVNRVEKLSSMVTTPSWKFTSQICKTFSPHSRTWKLLLELLSSERGVMSYKDVLANNQHSQQVRTANNQKLQEYNYFYSQNHGCKHSSSSFY